MTEKKSLSFPPPMKTFEGRLQRESRPLPSFPRKRESSIDFMVPRLREDNA